jgi:hypothetical protein
MAVRIKFDGFAENITNNFTQQLIGVMHMNMDSDFFWHLLLALPVYLTAMGAGWYCADAMQNWWKAKE